MLSSVCVGGCVASATVNTWKTWIAAIPRAGGRVRLSGTRSAVSRIVPAFVLLVHEHEPKKGTLPKPVARTEGACRWLGCARAVHAAGRTPARVRGRYISAVSGRNNAICGNTTNRIVTRIRIMINGGVLLMTSRYGRLNTNCAVKISTPNGGVAEPIAA